MDWLLQNITSITWQMAVMWVIGGALIYCAIKKDMEPTLLLPMGLGAILVNLPECLRAHRLRRSGSPGLP